jgi:hypothetical protein
MVLLGRVSPCTAHYPLREMDDVRSTVEGKGANSVEQRLSDG